MIRRAGTAVAIWTALCAAASGALVAADPIVQDDDFLGSAPFIRAVPSDVLFYGEFRCPRGGAFAAGAAGLRDALAEPTFLSSFAEYLGPRVRERKKGSVKESLDHWARLLGSSRWWRFGAGEGFLAARIEDGRRVWLAGTRVPASECDARFAEIERVLYGFAAILPNRELEVGRHKGASVIRLYRLSYPLDELCVSAEEGWILASTSRQFLRQAHLNLRGRTRDRGLELTALDDKELASVAETSRFLARRRSSWSNGSTDRVHSERSDSDGPPAGFFLSVRPDRLFADAIGDDALLGEWTNFVVAMDVSASEAALEGVFASDFRGGTAELRRVFERALLDPLASGDLGPTIAREVPVLLPVRYRVDESGRAEAGLGSPAVLALLRSIADWVKSAATVSGIDSTQIAVDAAPAAGGLSGRVKLTLGAPRNDGDDGADGAPDDGAESKRESSR